MKTSMMIQSFLALVICIQTVSSSEPLYQLPDDIYISTDFDSDTWCLMNVEFEETYEPVAPSRRILNQATHPAATHT